MGIGNQLKQIRKSKGITLTEMADKTQLSVGFLSNLERDITSPTIDVLHKICNQLSITINDILNPDEEKKSTDDSKNQTQVSHEEEIVRFDDRRLLFQENGGDLSYSSMTKGSTDFKVSSMTIKGNDLYKFAEHDHDELGICISGCLEIQINEKSYYLYPGDSIYIPSGTMHSGRKASDEICESHWIKLSTELNELARKMKGDS